MTARHRYLVYFNVWLNFSELFHPPWVVWRISAFNFIDIVTKSSAVPNSVHAIEQIISPYTVSVNLMALNNSPTILLTVDYKFELSEIANLIAGVLRFDHLDWIYGRVRI